MFESLTRDISAHLATSEQLAGVPVIDPTRTDASDAVLASLNRDMAAAGLLTGSLEPGLAVLVDMVSAEAGNANVPNVTLELVARVHVLENPTLNERAALGMTADWLAQQVMQLLHHWSPDGVRGCHLDPARPVQPSRLLPDGQEELGAGFMLTFRLGRWDLPHLAQCETPVAEATAGLYTFTTGTGDAEIWLTTSDDGTDPALPREQTGSAVRYSEPITIADGTRVRAAAIKAGLRASNTLSFVAGE